MCIMKTNNIKHIRKRLGLSQESFAEAVGISQGNVSHYECQRQEVSPEVARMVIAAACERGVFITFNDIYVSELAELELPSNPELKEIQVVTAERRTSNRRIRKRRLCHRRVCQRRVGNRRYNVQKSQ